LIFKNGKKSKIQKFILLVFLNIKLKGLNPGFIFIKAIYNATPTVTLKRKKVKGKIINIPKLISKKQKSSIGIKWIIKSALGKKAKFNENLANEFIETANFKSSSYKKKIEISKFLETTIIQRL
jgi:small subunit ribosomal protein S7